MALDGTYSGLKASVADWLHRTDLTNQIPDFIRMAEAQISRRLRLRRMVQRETATISGELMTLPTDFIEDISLVLTSPLQRDLAFQTNGDMDFLASRLCAAGVPECYGVISGGLRVLPMPDQPYQALLTYYGSVPALSDDNPTNWLLTIHPDIYLYGACVQAAPYMSDDERVPVWTGIFGTLLDDLQGSEPERTGAKLRTDPAVTIHRHRHLLIPNF